MLHTTQFFSQQFEIHWMLVTTCDWWGDSINSWWHYMSVARMGCIWSQRLRTEDGFVPDFSAFGWSLFHPEVFLHWNSFQISFLYKITSHVDCRFFLLPNRVVKVDKKQDLATSFPSPYTYSADVVSYVGPTAFILFLPNFTSQYASSVLER